MEQLSSQRFLLPIIPWFLDKYKPWTAKKAVMHDLYLGRSPPMFTDIRIVHPSTDDDHLVLELGMNFLAADDVRAILAVKLRKRLGFGVWTKLHVTGIHVEGRVLVGVKFLRQWPFIGRLRLCFVDPPFFQATVKPIFSHGVDVTEIPGISGWVDKLMAAAFSETLVEPNMLVVDVEKLVESQPQEADWFTVDERRALAYARVEILEGADMKPSDPNGLADPYVKGHLGPCRFQTNVQRKTLAPRWLEVFKIPITSWDAALLRLDVFDKDYIFDDSMGSCSVNTAELRGGRRHDLWLTLREVKMGRLHLAVTIVEDGDAAQAKEDPPAEGEGGDVFERLDIQGQQEEGIFVHRPGLGCDSHRWEPRRGRKSRHSAELQGEAVALVSPSRDSPAGSSSLQSGEASSGDEDESPREHKAHRKLEKIQRGLKKMGDLLVKSPRESPGAPSVGESEGGAAGNETKSKGRRDSAIGALKQVGSSAQSNLRKVLSKRASSKKAPRPKDGAPSDEATSADLDLPLSPPPAPGVVPAAGHLSPPPTAGVVAAAVGPVSPRPPRANDQGTEQPCPPSEGPSAVGAASLPAGGSFDGIPPSVTFHQSDRPSL
ncbi:C2 domain-containing protein At1g53590-like isoform X2 [Wolffia australiana]